MLYKRRQKGEDKVNKYEEATSLLRKYKQQEVLKELEKNKREGLIEQILHLDFEKIESVPYVDLQHLTKEEKEKYEQIGNSIIKQGKYAVVTMAGGQRNKARTQSDQKEPL